MEGVLSEFYEDKMPVIKVCTVQHYPIIIARSTMTSLFCVGLASQYSVTRNTQILKKNLLLLDVRLTAIVPIRAKLYYILENTCIYECNADKTVNCMIDG